MLRVIADVGDAGWLRWATPLGWPEEVRAFAGARPLVLLLPAAAGVLLLLLAGALSVRRDVGSGMLRSSRLVGAPPPGPLVHATAMALRSQLGLVAAWVAGVGAFALVVGFLSTSFSVKTISKSLQQTLAKVGGASIVTPAGALGFYFLFFVLVISLFACSQIGAARHEEADEQLETVLALPVGRRRWLGGRLVLGSVVCVALGLVAGALRLGGSHRSERGRRSRRSPRGGPELPAGLRFSSSAWAHSPTPSSPRAARRSRTGLVTVAFLWQLLGLAARGARLAVDLTPFQHVGLVPAEPFRAAAAAAMLAIGAVAALAALTVFGRRDLAGA